MASMTTFSAKPMATAISSPSADWCHVRVCSKLHVRRASICSASHPSNEEQNGRKVELEKSVLRGFKPPVEVEVDSTLTEEKAKIWEQSVKSELAQFNSEWFRHKKEMDKFVSKFVDETSEEHDDETQAQAGKDDTSSSGEVKVNVDEEDGSGWGFNYSDLFPVTEPQFMPPLSVDDGPTSFSEVLPEDGMDLWLEEREEVDDYGEVKVMSASVWRQQFYACRVPILVCAYSKWGPQSEQSSLLLQEVKKAAMRLAEYDKAPVRVLQLDVISEPQIAGALGKPQVGSLLFYRHGQLVFQTKVMAAEEEIMQLVGHHLFGGPKVAAIRKF